MSKFVRKTNEEKKAEVQEAIKKIEEGVKNVFTSDDYKNFLKSMTHFNNYSINNIFLIAAQKPEATKVCSYTTWKNEFNRNVKKGEKGIKILAPCKYKVEKEVDVAQQDGSIKKEKQEVEYLTFKMTTCFDISQTEGEPVPSLCNELLGEDERAKAIIDAIHKVSGCNFEKKPASEMGGAFGYFIPGTKNIAIKEGISEIHEAKTSIHEYAHALLHDFKEKEDRPEKEKAEIEAESVAFIVCNHFGINTDEYSFPYVASWSQDKKTEELKDILDNIKTKAIDMINDLEPEFLKNIEQLEYKEYTNEENMELSNGYFLNIHECDEGYDYTIYNEEKVLLDGGILTVESPKEAFDIIIDELQCTNRVKEVGEIEEKPITLKNVINQVEKNLVNQGAMNTIENGRERVG